MMPHKKDPFVGLTNIRMTRAKEVGEKYSVSHFVGVKAARDKIRFNLWQLRYSASCVRGAALFGNPGGNLFAHNLLGGFAI